MSKRLKLFLLFSCLYAFFGRDGAHGQTTTVSADCIIKFSFAVGAAPVRVPATGFPNKVPSVQGLPCGTWVMSYQAPTTVSAISIELDSGPDTAGAPGSWGAFSGTVIATAANPLLTASLPGSFLVRQNVPAWVSVRLNSATGTGTITGAAYGWVLPPAVYTTSSGTGSNVTIVGPLGQALMASSIPVVIASNQSSLPVTVTFPSTQDVNVKQINGHTALEGGVNGGQGVGGLAASGAADAGNPVKVGGSNGTNDYNLKVDSQGNNYGFLGCTNTVEVPLSGTGYVEIVAGTALQTIQICKVFVTSAAAGAPVVNTFSIASATITTCAGTTELYSGAAITGLDSDWGGALRSGAGKSICVSESVANSDKVTISYSKGVF